MVLGGGPTYAYQTLALTYNQHHGHHALLKPSFIYLVSRISFHCLIVEAPFQLLRAF